MPVRTLHEPLIASVIIGNGWTHAQVNDYPKHFPSVVGISQTAFSNIDMENKKGSHTLTWEGTKFVWGAEVYNSSRLSATAMGAEKVGSVTYKRLLIAALYELFGARNISLDVLITTLPVYYYENERDRMRTMLSGSYTVTDDGTHEFTYDIPRDAVKILPEGLPTLYDKLYNNNLNVTDENLRQAAVGVVNIGTYTTDLIFIRNQKPMQAMCRSIDAGLSKVWDEIIRYTRTKYGRTIGIHEADEAMKKGFVQVGNRDEPIEAITEAMFEQLSDTIAQEINTAWDNGLAAQYILEAGGGGPQVHEYLAYRYSSKLNYISFKTVEEAAATEMSGALKFAKIRILKAT